MNSIPHSSFAAGLALSCLVLAGQPLPATAQIFGGTNGTSIPKDNQQQQEVLKVEEIPAPADTLSQPAQQEEERVLEQREQQLERELNLEEKNPEAPKREELPNPPESTGDNVPYQPPLDETEIDVPLN